MKKMISVAFALLMSLWCGVAFSQAVKIDGMPVRIGDSVEKAQAALQTVQEPEEYTSATQRGNKYLRLKTKGITVFFDKSGQAYTIKLEAPFSGNIGGVKIGNTQAFLAQKLGKPAKIIKGFSALSTQIEPQIYYIDDKTTVRFDFDRDAEIESIYILK